MVNGTQELLLLLSVVAGALGVPIVNWIKTASGSTDKKAIYITVGISLVLGAVAGVLSGVIPTNEFTVNTVLKVIQSTTEVLGLATLFYKVLWNGDVKKNESVKKK